MEDQKQTLFFILFSLYWVVLGWIGFLAALLGLFYSPIFIVYLAAGAAFIFYYFLKNKIKLSKNFILAMLLSFLFILIFSHFTNPTIFSGRDQGSISEAAIRLSQNHQLEFTAPESQEFFKVYGPGKALNFPGFYYTNQGGLTTQFPLPYISWLGIFYSLFGTSGLVAANGVLLFIFAFSFYNLAKKFTGFGMSLATLLLALTSFFFFWFFKFTLSENMALAFFWLAALNIINFKDKPDKLSFYSLILTLGLLFFSRIEGIALLAFAGIIIISDKNSRKWIGEEKKGEIAVLLAAFFLILAFNFSKNSPFYREIFKAVFDLSSGGSGSPIFQKLISMLYSLKILYLYQALGFLLMGGLGIVYFIIKKNYRVLIVFFFSLPLFVYFFDANISSDHPWMLRRFWILISVLIFYAMLLLGDWYQKSVLKTRAWKKPALALVLAAFFLNNIVILKYLPFSENQNLAVQTEELSRNFKSRDLVLIDRLTSGDGWSMISGPMSFLYKKSSVYFFNPADLEKIDTRQFDNIYLVSPEENINYWRASVIGNRLSYYQDYSINTTRLEAASLLDLPATKYIRVSGTIFKINK